MATNKEGGKNRKHNRSKRKADGRITPISRYVRNKISAEEYFRLTNQKNKSV